MSNRLEPTSRSYDEKLQRILKISAKIFAEKGFHRTSVRDISRATKMSLAGLYYYFTTKEELLYLIQERCFVTLLQRWERAASPGGMDVRARIRLFAENHLSFFCHNMHEMKVMAHEDESLTGDFQVKILVLKRRYVKVIMDLIRELQEEAGGRGLDLRVATFSLFGMMNWIYTWYQPKRDLPLPQLMEQMLRIYFFGVLQGATVEAPWFNATWGVPSKETFSLWQNSQ